MRVYARGGKKSLRGESGIHAGRAHRYGYRDRQRKSPPTLGGWRVILVPVIRFCGLYQYNTSGISFSVGWDDILAEWSGVSDGWCLLVIYSMVVGVEKISPWVLCG